MLNQQQKQIAKHLLLLGVAPQYIGYQYLLTATQLVMEDPSLLSCITKGLYQEIADKHHANGQII